MVVVVVVDVDVDVDVDVVVVVCEGSLELEPLHFLGSLGLFPLSA